MAVKMLGKKKIAVLISKPQVVIILDSGEVWEADSRPYKLESSSQRIESPLGGECLAPPTYGAPRRLLSEEERQADVAITTQLPGMVETLRAADFRGAIMAPGFFDVQIGGVRAESMILLSPSVEQAERVKAVRSEADRLIAESISPGAAAVRAVHTAIGADHEE